MPALITDRRKFLTGLSTLIVAPSIVRAASLMPVRSFDPYYTRYIIDYNIGSDCMALRIDRATFPLSLPKTIKILTKAEAMKFLNMHDKEMLKTLIPEEGKQVYFSKLLASSEEWMRQTGMWQHG